MNFWPPKLSLVNFSIASFYQIKTTHNELSNVNDRFHRMKYLFFNIVAVCRAYYKILLTGKINVKCFEGKGTLILYISEMDGKEI